MVDIGGVSAPICDAPSRPSVSDDPSVDSHDSPTGAERIVLWSVVAIALMVILWIALHALTSSWHPFGDRLTMELRVDDVGGRHTPLVGIYSRYGWNHPGPMLTYLLALPYRLTGSSDSGMLLGTLLINLMAVGASLVLAARVGLRTLTIVALFTSLVCVGLGAGGLTDPWNPYVVVLPLLAAAVASWRCAHGDRVAAVVLIVCGSFAVQSHVGSGVPVATLMAIALVALVVRASRGDERAHARRTLLIAAIVAIVCWIPPLIDQAVHSPGNLRLLLDFFLSGDGTKVGFHTGIDVIFRVLSIPGNWVAGRETELASYSIDTGGTAVPWALLALVVAAWWSWRRGWRSEFALSMIASAFIASSILAVAQIVSVAVPYLVRWTWAVGAFTWLTVAIVLARQLVCWGLSRSIVRMTAATGTAVALLVIAFGGYDVSSFSSLDGWQRTMDAVVPVTMAALEDQPGPVFIPSASGVDGLIAVEVLARAERAGLDVRRGPEWGYIFGAQRTIDPALSARTLLFMTGNSRLDIEPDPRFREIISFDPMSPEQRAEFTAIEDRHAGEFSTEGMSPRDIIAKRDENIARWRMQEAASAQQSADYKRYRQLGDDGEIVTVFISTEPIGS